MNSSLVTSKIYRIAYIVAMYSGLRAAYNCLLGLFLDRPQTAAVLDGGQLSLSSGRDLLIRVHPRAPDALATDLKAGMISVRLSPPKVSRTLYSLLCLTSHFGCGHIEIAFYETEAGRIVIYGIRNIISANVNRLGQRSILRGLPLENAASELHVLKAVVQALERGGLTVALAPPHECVRLAVDEKLLHPNKRDEVLNTMRTRYARLWKQTNLRDESRAGVPNRSCKA